MASLEEIRIERIKKREILKESGKNPYPAVTHISHTVKVALDNFNELLTSKDAITVGGRVMALRKHGGSVFVDLFDGTGKVQIFISKAEIGEESFGLFVEAIDASDFIEVTGTAFLTKRETQAVMASGWEVLSKALRSVPAERFAITDEDERYRRRYLDILLNENIADMVKKRSIFWNAFRSFLLEKDFIEVDTPVLENTTGGADARPFVTHHNELDIDVYLRISAGELWQKKLMVAGIPKVFEIGRIFRNEGMSNEHLQDYTQMEFYQAYSDYREGMKFITDMYRYVAMETFGTLKFEIRGFSVDLGEEWQEYDYCKIVEERFGINPLETSLENILEVLEKEGIKFNKKDINLERGVDTLWKVCRKDIGGPGFLINVPVYLEPLAKKSAENEKVVERFQILLAGSEMGKGFTELNDPEDQQERFEHQESLRADGDDEAQMNDVDYVEAMEYGMPPTFGFGVSERLFSFLMDISIREAQIFPLMRPKK